MARDRTDADSEIDLLPEVLFLDDVAALLRCSPSTIKRPRWSQASFAQWLAVVGRRRRARAGAAVECAGGRGDTVMARTPEMTLARDERSEYDARHPRCDGLWRAGTTAAGAAAGCARSTEVIEL